MTIAGGTDDGTVASFTARLAAKAAEFDARGRIDPDVIDELAASGLLGATVPERHGGPGYDDLAYGRLCATLGAACSSTRSLVTVHNMVAQAILRWGTDEQRDRWLPALASGETKAAFCLTEPETGSDGGAVATAVRPASDGWVVDGTKLWVTGGTTADVFLVIGRAEAGPVAVLVERDAPGVTIEPTGAVLGLRAAMLATVRFEAAPAPPDALVARPGFGWSHVAATALDHGRFSVAWGCVGILRSCLDVATAYALERHQFGDVIARHQLIRRLIADMETGHTAADALACDAAARRRDRDPSAIHATMVAKYFASGAAARAAADAVQILGAAGTGPHYPVERHFRDAKIMQIIEGSDQMQQLAIADHVLRGAG
ncbi:MAG TPA: acyl-CoA dehydrogenase family protein [Actinomycetota bacterium]|nr:acyl-CoA dehydrogenase family protein [Actinomycetota bacterium]